MPLRTLVLGDLQAPLATLLHVLRHHDALDGDHLRDDVHLVSIGDYVDYGHDPAQAAHEGEAVLDWVAAQAPERITILLGNHDVARVMEFSGWTDDRFAAARAALLEGRHVPDAPTRNLVTRDCAAYTEGQARRIRALIRDGRMRLATTVNDADGRPLLVTHAGVTRRELSLLVQAGRLADDDQSDAIAVADALQSFFTDQAARSGPSTPLDLTPLYIPASEGREAGGLLYHRPANDDRAARPDADLAWEFDPDRPRRYAPHALPRGLSQVCGHTPHRRAWRELIGFHEGDEGAPGVVRTLVVGDAPRYTNRRLPPAAPGEAHVYYIDADLAKTPPSEVRLFTA